jgi:hypothetical protein
MRRSTRSGKVSPAQTHFRRSCCKKGLGPAGASTLLFAAVSNLCAMESAAGARFCSCKGNCVPPM